MNAWPEHDAPWHCGQCVGGWGCAECRRLFSEPGDPALTSSPGGGAGPDETPSAAKGEGRGPGRNAKENGISNSKTPDPESQQETLKR